jgi:hypothetical protein
MIIVKFQGGLGNQLFQYAFGRAVSKRLNTSLGLDTNWFRKSKNREFELDTFNVEGKKIGILWRFFHYKKMKMFQEKTPNFDSEALKISDNSLLEGYWQSEKYFKDIQSELRQELTLKHSLGKTAEEWAQKIKKTESVSVHIRRGDYLDPKHADILGVIPLSYYENAANFLIGKNQRFIFFIFSDDIDWAKENIHLPGQSEFVSDGNRKIQPKEEMILMSICKHNIIANSSFSWWGAWLNTHSEKIVVSPKKWFLDEKRIPQDLIPSSWIQME